MKRLMLTFSAFAAFGLYAGPFDKAVLHGDTDKERAIDYKPGEEMTFTLALQGAEKVADDEYFVLWSRTGDDGEVQTGKVDVNKLPLVVKTKIAKPGFVRVRGVVVDKKNQPYKKQYTGDTSTPEGKRAMVRQDKLG